MNVRFKLGVVMLALLAPAVAAMESEAQ